jgi:hypothetical protein
MKTRIWNYTETFPGKVNFIDDNNVILGYDLGQDCCEQAFWTVSEAKDGSEPLYQGDDTESKEIELEGYVFDPAFCERSDDDGREQYVAIFKLVYRAYGEEKPDLYVRLENHHNGYYGHGFAFRGTEVIEAVL